MKAERLEHSIPIVIVRKTDEYLAFGDTIVTFDGSLGGILADALVALIEEANTENPRALQILGNHLRKLPGPAQL